MTPFWEWIAAHPEIPIVWTEGGKKALCLLSQGEVAIALYGVNGGYLAKDGLGNSVTPYLAPDLPASSSLIESIFWRLTKMSAKRRGGESTSPLSAFPG